MFILDKLIFLTGKGLDIQLFCNNEIYRSFIIIMYLQVSASLFCFADVNIWVFLV